MSKFWHKCDIIQSLFIAIWCIVCISVGHKGRGVQQKLRLIQPVWSDSRTGQLDADDSQRRVSASKTYKRRVSWRVFSPKPEETQPNWNMEHYSAKFFRTGEISTISGEISARSMKSPPDLARSLHLRSNPATIWWVLPK